MALVYLGNGSLTQQLIALQRHRKLSDQVQRNHYPGTGDHCLSQAVPELSRAAQRPAARVAAAALPYQRRAADGNVSNGSCASVGAVALDACCWRGSIGGGGKQALEVGVALRGRCWA